MKSQSMNEVKIMKSLRENGVFGYMIMPYTWQ